MSNRGSLYHEPLLYYIQDRKAPGATVQLSFIFFFFHYMRPLSYYETTSVSIPRQDEYMTIYYYRKGVMVGMKRQFDEDFVPPKNCVEEKVLDEISYNAHMKHYQEENLRLQNEFRKDLIAKYNMTGHPKADKLFNKAWDLGCSLGYEAVEDYFQDLTELFQEDVHLKVGCGKASLFNIMTK